MEASSRGPLGLIRLGQRGHRALSVFGDTCPWSPEPLCKKSLGSTVCGYPSHVQSPRVGTLVDRLAEYQASECGGLQPLRLASSGPDAVNQGKSITPVLFSSTMELMGTRGWLLLCATVWGVGYPETGPEGLDLTLVQPPLPHPMGLWEFRWRVLLGAWWASSRGMQVPVHTWLPAVFTGYLVLACRARTLGSSTLVISVAEAGMDQWKWRAGGRPSGRELQGRGAMGPRWTGGGGAPGDPLGKQALDPWLTAAASRPKREKRNGAVFGKRVKERLSSGLMI